MKDILREFQPYLQGKIAVIGSEEIANMIRKIGFDVKSFKDISEVNEKIDCLVIWGKIGEKLLGKVLKDIKFLIIKDHTKLQYILSLEEKLGMKVIHKSENFVVLARMPERYEKEVKECEW